MRRRFFPTKSKGRVVVCSLGGHSTVQGTTQLCGKLVFHFCTACWQTRREDCHGLMLSASAPVEPRRDVQGLAPICRSAFLDHSAAVAVG